MKFDFSGYATKHDIKCSDGRTIRQGAFKHHDGQTVPLVWQHMHDDPSNVLGHAVLENRPDGVYAYCTFNNTDSAQNAKELVSHGDVEALSIYANRLKEKGGEVFHGQLRDVSLVLAGANPGALIDYVSFQHGDTTTTSDDEAVIYTGATIKMFDEDAQTLAQADENDLSLTHADESTVGDIFNSFSEEEKNVVYFLIGQALESAGAGETQHNDNDEGEDTMKHNVFDNENETTDGAHALSHAEVQTIFKDAPRFGSLKESVLAHAATYGIENIDVLFPDAKNVMDSPAFISRRMEWVNEFITGTHHTPFSRIRSMAADITAEEARARGYVKGTQKKDEVIKLLKRITEPTTIYKKQRLDRDDILDITDMNVVSWLKAEMRVMLDEELARAIIVGDGRPADSDDKIDEDRIRPIAKDDMMYNHKVKLPANATARDAVDFILRSMAEYRGSGNPTLYISPQLLTDMLLIPDGMGRRLYPSKTELQSATGVNRIVEVPIMDGQKVDFEGSLTNLFCVIVNLKDYRLGADAGGQIGMFDDFDIDFNQHKYLIETRCSGALVLPKSAITVTGSLAPAPLPKPLGEPASQPQS